MPVGVTQRVRAMPLQAGNEEPTRGLSVWPALSVSDYAPSVVVVVVVV